ncbi:hypothetical protein [Persicobacter diffluens]
MKTEKVKVADLFTSAVISVISRIGVVADIINEMTVKDCEKFIFQLKKLSATTVKSEFAAKGFPVLWRSKVLKMAIVHFYFSN